jgi:choline dehydrogenase-like flavoprotein
MYIDARTLSKKTVINTDICIVGAGAAGITLARELIGQSFRVCLLESGGLEYDNDTQSLYKGRITGLPYYPLDAARLRFFGGTTNHWNGACRPLDAIDFEARAWVPHSGWPFSRTHLWPFYERAQTVLQLGPLKYDGASWEREDHPQAKFTGNSMESGVFQNKPTRFGQLYREEIRAASNVDTYLHANVLEFEANESGRAVKRLRVTSLARNDFFVSARTYVLATGGIENARLLLLSNRTNRNGLGNNHGLVGRFFMDHPGAAWGKFGIIAPSEFPLPFYSTREDPELDTGAEVNPYIWGFITPTAQTLRQQKLMNCGISVKLLREEDPPGIASMRHIKNTLASGKWPDDFSQHLANVLSDINSITLKSVQKITGKELAPKIMEIEYWAEPRPNPDSRVRLSGERDALGQPRVVLDWRLTGEDLGNARKILNLLATELGRSNLGRLRIDPETCSDKWMSSMLEGSYHHMGTTRMHKDPRQGVVDPDCRVHGLSNLYIAGSSVFPTAGHANPTLTIVALALRLADHLKKQMG